MQHCRSACCVFHAKLPCFQESTFYTSTKIFNSFPSFLVTIHKNNIEKLNASLRKYKHIHFSLDEFLCLKMIYNTVFCKMFVVFYTVNLYISLFMTCSTSRCLFDILMDPWNVPMYVQRIPKLTQVPLLPRCYLERLSPVAS